MKRKSKDTPAVSEKKSERGNNNDDSKDVGELWKVINALQSKVKDQEKQIEQLFEANKGFKNSVLALYTELENQKSEKKDYPDLMKMFKNQGNFGYQGPKSSMNNMFYIDGNNFNGMKCNSMGGKSKIIEVGMNSFYKNNMIENGNLSNKNTMMAIKEDMGVSTKKRDSLRSPSPSYPEAWKRVQGVNSRPQTPTSGLRKEFTDDNISEYSHGCVMPEIKTEMLNKGITFVNRENSVPISDFDGFNRNIDDNVSICSNPGFSAFQINNPHGLDKQPMIINNFNTGMSNNGRLETFSKQSNGDISDLRSISEFSADNRFCGIKRMHP